MGKLSALCGVFALGLLALGIYWMATDKAPEPEAALAVDQSELDLGLQPDGTPVPIQFRVTNRSGRPVRVVGVVPT